MAQLKSTNITGNLAVTGNVVANKLIKLGGTASQILMADGSTLDKSSVGSGSVTSVTVTGNNGLTGTGTITTSGTITLSHADTSSQSSMTTGGRTYVNSITLDTYGHVTAIGTGTETITSYSLPLAANGTRGGIQIGYSSTENNRAVSLSSEKAYVALPDRLKDFKATAENSPSTSGWYFFNDTGNTSAVAAFGSNAQAATWVSAYSNSWAAQLGISYYSNGIAMRRKNNSTSWSEWIPIATQDWVKGLGYVTGSYLPLAGGTMTGAIVLPGNKMSLKLRTHDSYETGWVYGTSGNEAITLAMQNPVTAFQIVYGTKPSAYGTDTWQTVTPLFQTKDGKVIINRKITVSSETTNLKLLDVNGEMAATTIYENGTSLSAKYLGISAKAADSDKLDGYDSSHYLNYNNLTNKPTISTVNNGTLTMNTSGTGLSGSASFTANQSGNSTFTVALNSSSAGNRSANQVVLAAAAGQINSTKYTITSGATAKATWQYNSTTDCIELVW